MEGIRGMMAGGVGGQKYNDAILFQFKHYKLIINEENIKIDKTKLS